MGSVNIPYLSSILGYPMTTKHTLILIGLDHSILWLVLDAVMKREHMISQCISCNTNVATPGPFLYPNNVESLTVFPHLQELSAFENIFILINEIRGKRKSKVFFNLMYSQEYIIACGKTASVGKVSSQLL